MREMLIEDQKLKTATIHSIISRGTRNTTDISTCLPISVVKFKEKHGIQHPSVDDGDQKDCKIKLPDFKNVK